MPNKTPISLSELPDKEKRHLTSKLGPSCDACAPSKIRCWKERPVCACCVATSGSCVYGMSQKSGRAPRIRSCHLQTECLPLVFRRRSAIPWCHVQQQQQMLDTDCHSAADMPFSNRASPFVPPPMSLSPLSTDRVQDTVLTSISQCSEDMEYTREQLCSTEKGGTIVLGKVTCNGFKNRIISCPICAVMSFSACSDLIFEAIG